MLNFVGNEEYRMWVRGQVTIEEQNSGFRIIFEALPFRDYSLGSNMIALDDIRVMDGGICAPKRKSNEPPISNNEYGVICPVCYKICNENV